MYQIHNGDCAEVMASMGDDSVDACSKDDPIFVVRLAGTFRPEDIEWYRQEFSEQFPGRVLIVDSRVDDIYKVTREDVEKLEMIEKEVQ